MKMAHDHVPCNGNVESSSPISRELSVKNAPPHFFTSSQITTGSDLQISLL